MKMDPYRLQIANLWITGWPVVHMFETLAVVGRFLTLIEKKTNHEKASD